MDIQLLIAATPLRTSIAWIGVVWLLCGGLPAAAQVAGVAPGEGVDLHYTVRGQGPPLLILNGGPGFPSTHFGPLAEALSGNHQTILFDQRGTGASTLPHLDTTTVNVAAMVADIEALRVHLDVESWIVMGHSWGGMYAMLYAAHHPGRVRALVLSASGGIDLAFLQPLTANIRARLTDAERAILDSPPRPDDTPVQARRRRVEAMAPAYVYHRAHVPKVVHALAEASTYVPRVNALVFEDLRRIDYDLRDVLRSFGRPALVLQGRQDFLGEDTALKIHQTLPQSELVWIEACSHYLWWDQPEAYFGAIRGFLEALEAG